MVTGQESRADHLMAFTWRSRLMVVQLLPKRRRHESDPQMHSVLLRGLQF